MSCPGQESEYTGQTESLALHCSLQISIVHQVNDTITMTQIFTHCQKMGGAEKRIQNNESTKCKKRKKGCEFIEFLQ